MQQVPTLHRFQGLKPSKVCEAGNGPEPWIVPMGQEVAAKVQAAAGGA